jgi:hypothetical protein
MDVTVDKENGSVVRIYKGDTFKTLIRQYSFDRMQYDPNYRRAVRKAKAEKKATRKAKDVKPDETRTN